MPGVFEKQKGQKVMSASLAGLLFFVGIVALFTGIFIADTRYERRVKTGKYPCGECFVCTKYWLFADRYGRVDEIKLRRYIEDYHIDICKYQELELYGGDGVCREQAETDTTR